MKRKTWMIILMATVAAVSVIGLSIAAGAATKGKFGLNVQAPAQRMMQYQATAVTGTLTEGEKASLLYMREEEKLAHDVYVALEEAWDAPIFAQIANSELNHTESIAFLIERYGLKDPAVDSKPGVFVNKDLQALYAKLVADGKVSLTAAYKVALTIEDLDIKDLEEDLKATKNADVTRVYENLLAGSMNHLNAYYAQLKNLGGEYAPQYVTAEHFKEIIDGGYGQARMMQGRGMVGGMMQGARPIGRGCGMMNQYNNNGCYGTCTNPNL